MGRYRFTFVFVRERRFSRVARIVSAFLRPRRKISSLRLPARIS
jgi:hypothetical protein